MAELNFLTKSRGFIRTRITKLHGKVHDEVAIMNSTVRATNLAKFEQMDVEIRKLDREIAVKVFAAQQGNDDEEDDSFEAELSRADHYSSLIVESVVALKEGLSGSSVAVPNDALAPNKLKLPELPLPQYSYAKGESLKQFLSSFESIIGKYSLSTYEKFIFLKRQLKGEPLTLIDSLDVTAQSYENAKDLLEKAFANELSEKFNAIRRLAELKLSLGDNPYEFVSEVRMLKDLFQTLPIDIDTVLQYFVWTGMNGNLQTHLVQICAANKPTFSQITDNIFIALERYNEVAERIKLKKEKASNVLSGKDTARSPSDYAGYAAVVNVSCPSSPSKTRSFFCSLCSDKDGSKERGHSTRDCSIYKTPLSKRQRLKNIGACTLCGFSNHSTEKCRFKFSKPCAVCAGAHMSFLCVVNKNPRDKAANPKNPQYKFTKGSCSGGEGLSSGTVCTESSLQVHVGSESILPTFTCHIGERKIRCLKDSGCQPHFIETRLAEELNLPVVSHNVPVTVNGFNESHKYITNVVEVSLRIGHASRIINAMCVPKIKTRLVLPELGKVVNGFIERGYKLADEFLHDQSHIINDLEFVLGSNDPDILLERQVKFGGPASSVFSVTEAGIMLMGNSRRILENLPLLRCASEANLVSSQCDFASNLANFSPVTGKVSQLRCGGDADLIDSRHNIECNLTAFLPNAESSIGSNALSNLKEDDEFDEPSFAVINDEGEVNESELYKAASEIILAESERVFTLPTKEENETSTELNDHLVKYVLNETKRATDGRLEMPITWRGEVSHLLGRNFHLSKQVLSSNLKRWQKREDYLHMVDEVFREQETEGVIERIEDLSTYLADQPCVSFLPHMGVFKLDRATTKCRVVFLSNLAERGYLNHNQVMHPGPSLNHKLSTATLHLRFGSKLLSFDLKRAFLQIALRESDANRLLFLWYRNVEKKDFSLIAYRNLRLSFGLRCSPTILMLGLYKILCLDSAEDDSQMKEFKRQLYALLYMDNGSITGNSEQLLWAYQNLSSVFDPYKFEVQQLVTNDSAVQGLIDTATGESTPNQVKLLGLTWHRGEDELSTQPLDLDPNADTKRKILTSVAKQYDLFGFQGPCLNRARLFLHGLQCDASLKWDEVLQVDALREWKRVVKQANSSFPPHLPRCFGDRSDPYKLIAFTDASKSIYAAVIYLQNLITGHVGFVVAKNRMVNRKLELKTIPSLELQALSLGVELLFDLREELSGTSCLLPINICDLELYTDSMICLHWLNAHAHKLEKMQKHSVFVMNRLDSILKSCEAFPVTFGFVATDSNPADCMSRPLSYNQLLKSTYFSGPLFLKSNLGGNSGMKPENFLVKIPSPLSKAVADENKFEMSVIQAATVHEGGEVEHLIPLERYSSFHKLVRVQMRVLQFVSKLWVKRSARLNGVERELLGGSDANLYDLSTRIILRTDQEVHYGNLLTFLRSGNVKIKDIPPIVDKLNVFLDSDGILKVKSKFDRWRDSLNFCCPVLLPKESTLTKLIIRDAHLKLAHAGCYNLLSHLRRSFFVVHFFSTVKRVLKECVVCRRLNSRVVKLNQSPYRDFRVLPPSDPYKYLFVDYIGPITVKNPTKTKLWLLCFTCLWSRAVNLKVCLDLSVKGFLRAFQMHVYEYGMPSRVFSDLGSQLTAGAIIIADLLNNVETQAFLSENGISCPQFEHYFRGNSALGSLVEVCVKQVKKLMFGSVGNSLLSLPDFELLVAQTIHLCNKRPVAFKEALRDNDSEQLPAPITPELLVRGRDLISANLLPCHDPVTTDDPTYLEEFGSVDMLRKEFSKLNIVRGKLESIYNDQFLNTLIDQAVDLKGRYKPVSHVRLAEGDLILLREPHRKVYHFPMAIVKRTYTNEMGEVTKVEALKGKTREVVRRHVSSVIPLVSRKELGQEGPGSSKTATSSGGSGKSHRKAAVRSGKRTKGLFNANLA